MQKRNAHVCKRDRGERIHSTTRRCFIHAQETYFCTHERGRESGERGRYDKKEMSDEANPRDH